MFNSETPEATCNKMQEILNSYGEVAQSALNCLEKGFKSNMMVMILPPKGIRRHYRTSKHIERLNKKLKRRSKVIGVFPNEESLIRLMGSVLVKRHKAEQSCKTIFKKEFSNSHHTFNQKNPYFMFHILSVANITTSNTRRTFRIRLILNVLLI